MDKYSELVKLMLKNIDPNEVRKINTEFKIKEIRPIPDNILNTSYGLVPKD